MNFKQIALRYFGLGVFANALYAAVIGESIIVAAGWYVIMCGMMAVVILSFYWIYIIIRSLF